jgi:hypothetical protein
MSDDKFSWHQLPDEPTEWSERFQRFYLRRSKRSIRGAWRLFKASQGVEINQSASGAWAIRSEEFRWKERGDDWALWQLDKEMREREEHERLAVKNTFNSYWNLVKLAAKTLFDPDSNVEITTSADAIRALEVGGRGVLLMAGHPTDRMEMSAEISDAEASQDRLKRLSVDDLEALQEIYAKIEAEQEPGDNGQEDGSNGHDK